MGMTSALKLRQITWNAERVISIELLAAAEGLDYRAPLRSSTRIERAREMLRSLVPRVTEDRSLAQQIELLARAIQDGDFDEFIS
jgi:histidine ammonia-lyase